MTEITSPFLNNEPEKNNNTGSNNGSKINSTLESTVEIDDNGNIDQIGVDNKNHGGMSEKTSATQSRVFAEHNDGGGIMEIKKDSNLLKNVIIALIILLILAILGLVLWNFFNKNKVGSPVDNVTSVEPQEKTIIETANFEMSGDNFKASSVVVEE